MPEQHVIALYAPGEAPIHFDLDGFGKEVVRFGRGSYHGDGDERNDIRISESMNFVSRAHCHFERNNHGEWFVVDDESKNGLVVGGKRVPWHRLSDGDKVYIGQDPKNQLLIVYSSVRRVTEVGEEVAMTRFPLGNVRRCVIGRASDCDIVISHPAVSRRHCVITQDGGRYYIEDNQSKNGVLLNSTLLEGRRPLNPMDRISIGGTTIVFNGDCLYYQIQEGGVGIVVDHVTKRVGKKKALKTITNDVSLTIRPNQFVAIIGGSGAGKTTLLNCISGVTDISAGDVLVNGESLRNSGRNVRSLMGYVPQQDIVYDNLTLERMLMYSAKLRMPPDTSEQEIKKKITETLQTVELDEHRKTMISKLSGGQRKRARIAVELLASPKVFFLDEPSSGLDPGTEKHLMQMLKRLSANGRTVVMVTHTVQNIDLCDSVICMGNGGRLCYCGAPSNVLRFFGKQSMSDVYDELNENSRYWEERFREYQALGERSGAGEANKRKRAKSRPGTQLKQFSVMTARYSEMLFNSRARFLLLMLMPVLLTLLVCLAFDADGNLNLTLLKWKISWGSEGLNLFQQWIRSIVNDYVRKTFPFLAAGDTVVFLFSFSCAVFWTGIFNSIQEISKERPIYERERFAGVGVVPYVMSKFVPLALLCLAQAAIMTLIMRAMANTTATLSSMTTLNDVLPTLLKADGLVLGKGLMWLETLLTTYLCALSAMCIGLLISSIVSNDMALVLCPICLLPQILFSGIVVKLSGFTSLIGNLISCRWTCLAYLVSTDVNAQYTEVRQAVWNPGGAVPMPKPSFETVTSDIGCAFDSIYDKGTRYLFGLNGVKSGWIALGIMCVVCVAGAIVILRFKRRDRR